MPGLLLLAACGGTQAIADCPVLAPLEGAEVCPDAPTCEAPAVRPTDASLNAVVWMQSSAEYAVLTMQVFRDAARQLDTALADPTWTASPEQVGTDFASLPPAIILDLDETVLDNSAYQAWLIVNEGSYSRETWNAWCDAEEATAIPGAVDFLTYADAQGVALFYVTNRYAEARDATLRNLQALGVPLPDDERLLLRGEREEWTSEKGTRRAWVGERYRIVQLHGDNLGDFIDGYDTTVDARDAIVAAHDAWWGTRWFMFPNPQYGSWESAVLQGRNASTPVERWQGKVDSMRVWSGPAASP